MEKERPLDAAVFFRFAACGAACGTTAHALLIPIDVVKTRYENFIFIENIDVGVTVIDGIVPAVAAIAAGAAADVFDVAFSFFKVRGVGGTLCFFVSRVFSFFFVLVLRHRSRIYSSFCMPFGNIRVEL